MKEQEIREGDIVEIDYIDELTEERISEGKALVMWKGFNHQLLIHKLDAKHTIWSGYDRIVKVIGHVDIERYMENAITLEREPCEDKGEISDGHHTVNQLYHQRAVLFATIVNEHPDISWKSFKHSDGHYCFDEDGEMFIVGIDTPEGPYTYHYHKKYWDLFKCKELECGKEWDGHTEKDVTRLLSLKQELKTGHWIYDYISADGHKTYHCSECGCYLKPKHSEPLNSFKWCSLCGAKMIESQESEDAKGDEQ